MGDVHPAENKLLLCRQLSQITFERWGLGIGKTTLCNSGFEAVEVAIKTSILHSGKPGVIGFTGGYHGLGYGALEVIGLRWFREPFQQQLRDFATIGSLPQLLSVSFRKIRRISAGRGAFPELCQFLPDSNRGPNRPVHSPAADRVHRG